MREVLWRIVASFAARPAVADWLIARAKRTPYSHIHDADGSVYMERYWLFNPYHKAEGDDEAKRWRWLPSLRIHRIMRPDGDRDLHDHPWNARTIILRGCYEEERPCNIWEQGESYREYFGADGRWLHFPREVFMRRAGYTGRLLFGQYHRISEVSEGGVWTLFLTWRKRGNWGFSVDGVKVPWRQYLLERGIPVPGEKP